MKPHAFADLQGDGGYWGGGAYGILTGHSVLEEWARETETEPTMLMFLNI